MQYFFSRKSYGKIFHTFTNQSIVSTVCSLSHHSFRFSVILTNLDKLLGTCAHHCVTKTKYNTLAVPTIERERK